GQRTDFSNETTKLVNAPTFIGASSSGSLVHSTRPGRGFLMSKEPEGAETQCSPLSSTCSQPPCLPSRCTRLSHGDSRAGLALPSEMWPDVGAARAADLTREPRSDL